MTTMQREIVSRAAMLVLGGALLFGGYKCLKTAYWLATEPQPTPSSYRQNRQNPSAIVWIVGGGLVLGGGFFCLAALVPVELFEKIAGPKEPPVRTHENPEFDDDRPSWGSWL